MKQKTLIGTGTFNYFHLLFCIEEQESNHASNVPEKTLSARFRASSWEISRNH
jgi:hypothetical protein